MSIERISSPTNLNTAETLTFSLLAIKPQLTPEAMNEIEEFTELSISVAGLKIVLTNRVTLDREDVIALYRDIFEDRGEESDWINNYRERLLDYMQSGPLSVMVVSGIDAQNKISKIKMSIRERFCRKEDDPKLVNYVHTPDESEFEHDLIVLLGITPTYIQNEY